MESIETLTFRVDSLEKEVKTLRDSDLEGKLWRAARDAQLRLMLGTTVIASGIVSYIIAATEVA